MVHSHAIMDSELKILLLVRVDTVVRGIVQLHGPCPTTSSIRLPAKRTQDSMYTG
jgi:hypothetical protein